ncbi:hypothetical protein ABW19_dt0209059 [Dactylella cylindrospora]|nr:hypothetical protein ABW19_dt0209059 [Dactylella cylindrospora]
MPLSSELSPEDRIRDLENEVKRLSKELEIATALPTEDDRNRTNKHATAPRAARSISKKTVPVFPAPATIAKKIIVILDATHRFTRPVPVLGENKRHAPPRTNPKRLSETLAAEHRDSRMRQLVYYASGRGVGDGKHTLTYKQDLVVQTTEAISAIDFGLNATLHQTVIDGYTYISDNWSSGDEIFLFGFSHGALAARAIAALITEIGLLNKAGMKHFDAVYDAYFNPRYGKIQKTDDYEDWREACGKLVYELSGEDGVALHKVSVKFLGCLDTIGWSSFQEEPSEKRKENEQLWKKGYITFRHLLLNEEIEHAFHALALDEDRTSHLPLLMFRAKASERPLQQVWFAGSHINIGGGQLTHEVTNNLPFWKPDPNELSDIVFLFMVSECHRFLTFSKKHVNRAVIDYMNIQAGLDILREGTYKNHWVAGKIDRQWPEALSLVARLRTGNISKKRRARTPLRYRPHWLEDESWSQYTSCESIHASSKYRKIYFPSYIPKALIGYYEVRTFTTFGANTERGDPNGDSGPAYNRRNIRQEKYYYGGSENSRDRLYCGDFCLPVLPMTAFEVLCAGGDCLISGFSLSYKDIYRDSPPVFRFTADELNRTREGWVMGGAPAKVSKISTTDRDLALRNASSLEASLRHRGLRIKEDNRYGLPQNTTKSTDPSVTPDPRNVLLSTENTVIIPTHKLSESADGPAGAEISDLEDESGTGKGKGKHSKYSGNIDEAGSVDSTRKLSFKRGTTRLKYAHTPDQASMVDHDFDYTDASVDSIPYEEAPIRIPVEPEWSKKIQDRGVVHPCKFKKDRNGG